MMIESPHHGYYFLNGRLRGKIFSNFVNKRWQAREQSAGIFGEFPNFWKIGEFEKLGNSPGKSRSLGTGNMQRRTRTRNWVDKNTESCVRTMVEPKVENKEALSEKKLHQNQKKLKASSTSTLNTGGKEKFEGASDEMKGNVFSIGRNQADVFTTTMNAFVMQVGIKYSTTVSAAARELKVRPTILKIPVTPRVVEANSRQNTSYRRHSSTNKHDGLLV